MEKYLSKKIQNILYASIFFVSIHHVFVLITNSSTLRFIFGLKTSEVLFTYGLASIFGICVYMFLLKYDLIENIKRNLYIATFFEIICLAFMYYFSAINQNLNFFVTLFILHHLITPYIMFNLDTLFEAYTHVEERGVARGIYLTFWNIPFVLAPLINSTIEVDQLPINYFISSLLLLPFLYLIFFNIKYPEILKDSSNKLFYKIKNFFKDDLDRKSLIVQLILHLYYATTLTLLPIYLHSVFEFDWNKISLTLAIMTTSFILIQIPFGNIEDRKHNEKLLFNIGLFMTILFTILIFFINPKIDKDISFLLLSMFLFLSHSGCSLIEISTEGMFYKHVTARDHTALLMFRMARIIPYSLGLLAIFWI